MLGAIIGDICGSTYEIKPHKTTTIKALDLMPPQSKFTDDSVLALAIAESLIYLMDSGNIKHSRMQKLTFKNQLQYFAKQYPKIGYGQMFEDWVYSINHRPYKSYGNGSAMRAVPIGFLQFDLSTVQKIAANSAKITHNHKYGIWGAKLIVTAIYLANQEESKTYIKDYLYRKFQLRFSENITAIRQWHNFDSSAKNSVPIALQCFFESENFEDAIRNCISIGGDADTNSCMCGAIAQAYYKKIPSILKSFAYAKIDASMKAIIGNFEKFCKIETEYT